MLAAALQATFGAASLHALPTGGQVVVPGSATIGAPVNNALTITNNPGAIINWQSFSIAPNELVRFVQQNAASAVLNRVTGSQMSEIMGRLQSNGRVFLVNPNGIVVGPGAVIDTAAFIGSTLPMLDRDFLEGRLRFQGDAASNGRILNQGSIRTGFGGQVVLVSPNIENSGLIEAPGGQVLLAAGKSVIMTSLNASGVSFELQAPSDSVVNIGQLLADGGVVRAFAGSLRHSGDIRANSLVRDAGGQIVLQGSREATLAAGSSTRADGGTGGSVQVDSAGTTRVEGRVSAIGASGVGGRIELTGDRVVLVGNASADASGAAGGGPVLVGGDWQGANAAVRNASSTFVGAGVTLKADATGNGDGGTIVAWADGNTRFLGVLSARGGAAGGDGGRAEVSGKGELLFIGGADLGAPKGRFGSLLLDPLDLFIDTAGGVNPFIIDETTDFPTNAVTVTPGTLAAITGNVALYASRDMRFNSNVTLTGAGQSLTAQAGRDLQLGSTLTTSNGAVSLNAGRAITTFGSPSIAAGTGAVSAVSENGGLALGAVSSAGSLAASATNGNLNLGAVTASGAVSLTTVNGSVATGNITTTGPIAINSAAFITGGTYTSGGGAVNLAAAGSVSTSGITTAGGSITASAATSIVSLGTLSTIAGSGPNGGALTVSAPQSTASTGNWTGGNGNAVLGGTSVDTGTLNTTGNVTLTASSGSINATIDNAASVVATSSRSFSSTSISLSSNTVLNANSITATAADCSFSSSCPGASITLSGALGVNVGTVTANAPTTFRSDRTAEYQSRSRSIDINGGNGPINAMGAGSQVTATDVTLRTTAGGGGGIGVSGTPLRVDVEGSFTFRPNGGFDVLLNGSGPIVFDARLGVAATGNTYTGALSMPGAITLNASATDSTVTVSNFSVVAGFDRPVYSSTPSIGLQTPNGALVVTSAAAPAGDNTGFAVCPPGFGGCSNPSILSLPMAFSASGALTVSNYIRAAGASGKSTSFTAGSGGIGALVLGTINGNRDTITATGDDSVTVNDVSTLGSVSVTSTVGGTLSGNVAIGRIGSGSSSVSVTANNGTIAALTDGVANEITSGGNVSLVAASIGTTGFANPLDIAGNSVSLTANGTAAGTGYIGSGATPTNPVVAATQALTVNATRQFNVDTGSVPMVNLTVTATPAGVGAGGIAQVRSDGQPFVFGSDGSKFTLNNLSTTTQLNGGTLLFISTAGSIDFGNIDFSATNGGLTLRAQQNATGDVTRIAGPVNLGSGRLTVQADRDVDLGDITVGGLSVSSVNNSFPGPGACETIGFSFVCATNTLTVGDITGGSFGGTFSATTRRAISAGVLDGVGTVSFNAYSGGISTGRIGSGVAPASSVTLHTDQTSAGGNSATGTIDAGTISLNAIGTATTGALNAAATIGGSVTNVSATGAVNTGTINAAAASPGQVLLRSNTSVTAGTIATSSLSVGAYTVASSPTIDLGAISGPSHVSVQGGAVTLGAIAMDAAGAGNLSINAAGRLTLDGAITAGNGTNAEINAGNNPPLLFSRIDTGNNGRVSISSTSEIWQTQEAEDGGGIRAGTVLLSATGGSRSIRGPGSDGLTLRNTSNLTLTFGNNSRISLVDSAGSAPGPELVNLDITGTKNDSTFVLDGLSPSQTLALVDTGGGTRITLNSGGSAAPLNFRYRNGDTAGAIEVTSINSNGGSVVLEAPNGDVRVTTINAAGPGVDRLVSISSGGRVDVAGVIDGGNSPVNISAAQAVRRTAVGGEVRSTTSVGIAAGGTSAIGASPANERFRVTAPAVNLDGGDIYADLTGTTDLALQVGNALSVASGADLTSLNLSIDATGSGPTSITTATQTFGLARNSGELEIGTIASGTPLGNLRVTTTSGGMRVSGTGTSSISADSLRLQSAGRLYIDGIGARAVLTSTDQQFLASGELRVEGQASLNASGSQSFTTFGTNDIVFAASGGAIGASAGTQTFSAGRDILLLGGSGGGDTVTVASTAGAQTLSASRSIVLTAGTGAGANVTLDSSGSGQQLLQALTSVTLTGGGTGGGSEAASVSVLQSGDGGQRLQARTSIVLTGGIGDDGTVLVHNNGAGTQSIGDPFS
ncbi:MAG: filamentous hemagglutinin N-terminal domain-containing protein, partial [bacterium]